MVCLQGLEESWVEAKPIQIKTLIISFAAIFCAEAATKIGISMVPLDRMLLMGLARLFETGALILIVLFCEKGLSFIGLARHTIFLGLKKGLIWSAGFGIVALVVFSLLMMAGVKVQPLIYTRLPKNNGGLILFLLIGGLVAPVTEEIFFRGILYGFFRRWGVFIALVLSTGIFILAHSLKGGIPITQLAGGILFAVAYEVEGNLMTPIVIHVLGNMGIFAVSMVA